MLHCQNCGQNNTQTSNFCRTCGTRLAAAQASFTRFQPGRGGYEFAPPRPYLWKTGELQDPTHGSSRKSPNKRVIQQVQPLAGLKTQPELNLQQLQPAGAAAIHYGFRCPRCQSQQLPRVTRKVSTAGWIVFAVLLVTFFPLFWLGFFIKDEIRSCAACNLRFE